MFFFIIYKCRIVCCIPIFFIAFSSWLEPMQCQNRFAFLWIFIVDSTSLSPKNAKPSRLHHKTCHKYGSKGLSRSRIPSLPPGFKHFIRPSPFNTRDIFVALRLFLPASSLPLTASKPLLPVSPWLPPASRLHLQATFLLLP